MNQDNKKVLGQFFTHPEVASFMAKLINPLKGEKIIDPACGDGEFLIQLTAIEPLVEVFGCEIDETIYAQAQQRLHIPHLFLHNGLYSQALYPEETDLSLLIQEESFDAVIANPPFNGLKNKVSDSKILSLFELARKDNKIRSSQSIEILFLERFVKLLKPSGRLCTILPEGILSDQRLSYLRDWLYERLSIEAIISLPKRGVFGSAYVNVVILCAHKKPHDNKKVFFVKDTKLEDLPVIYDYMKRNRIFIQ